MDESKSFELRYVGGRYDGGKLPVEMLSDLSAFRDLLVAFAKEDWKVRNEGRARVPKGFDKSLTFSLTSITKGSAIPKLEWNRDMAQVTLPGFSTELDDIVDSSYESLLKLIDGASNASADISLSSSHVRALNKFGAKLRQGERIEFLNTGGSNVIYLDTVRRRTLITRVHETYQQRYEGIGTFIGLNVDEGTICVKTTEYGNIYIYVAPDRIIEEFDGNVLADVQFDLNLELDHNDKIRNILDVYSAEIVETVQEGGSDALKDLAEIAKLEAGWLDGDGEAVSRTAIGYTHQVIVGTNSLNIDFRLYPTEQGGVLVEFDNDAWFYSLEISRAGTLHLVGVAIAGSESYAGDIFEQVSDEFIQILRSRMALK
jgi:hypothetical protein